MDTFSIEQRSECMRRIRSTDTQPEMVVRRLLHGAGFRYRLHRSDLPGRPDIVLPRYKVVVFVHGCFWHGHDACVDGHRPKSNSSYWNAKLEGNRQRDARNAQRLAELGWRRIVVWECHLKDREQLAKRVLSEIRNCPQE